MTIDYAECKRPKPSSYQQVLKIAALADQIMQEDYLEKRKTTLGEMVLRQGICDYRNPVQEALLRSAGQNNPVPDIDKRADDN